MFSEITEIRWKEVWEAESDWILFVFWSGYSISSSGMTNMKLRRKNTHQSPAGNLLDILVKKYKLCMKFEVCYSGCDN